MTPQKSLSKAIAWAATIAAVLLITVVLPSEYGIDWTGFGRLTGLTRMGEQKVAAAKAAASPQATLPAVAAAAGPARHTTSSKGNLRADVMEVTLAPQAEVEYKVVLPEGEPIVYEWDTGGAEVTFDFHGEPATGPQGAFMTFEKGSASRGAGTFKAPFAGTHGWYWKNPTAVTVIIKLRVSGFHSELKRM